MRIVRFARGVNFHPIQSIFFRSASRLTWVESDGGEILAWLSQRGYTSN